MTIQEQIAKGKTLKSTPAPAPKQVDARLSKTNKTSACQKKLKKSNNISKKTKTVLVIRSGLLQQIAAGKKLKKVDMTEKKQEPK